MQASLIAMQLCLYICVCVRNQGEWNDMAVRSTFEKSNIGEDLYTRSRFRSISLLGNVVWGCFLRAAYFMRVSI